MRKFLDIVTGLISAATLIFALLSAWGFITGGHETEAAMVLIIFMFMAALGGAAALAIGFLGRVLDRKAQRPVSRISNFGILTGVVVAIAGGLVMAFA